MLLSSARGCSSLQQHPTHISRRESSATQGVTWKCELFRHRAICLNSGGADLGELLRLHPGSHSQTPAAEAQKLAAPEQATLQVLQNSCNWTTS